MRLRITLPNGHTITSGATDEKNLQILKAAYERKYKNAIFEVINGN